MHKSEEAWVVSERQQNRSNSLDVNTDQLFHPVPSGPGLCRWLTPSYPPRLPLTSI